MFHVLSSIWVRLGAIVGLKQNEKFARSLLTTVGPQERYMIRKKLRRVDENPRGGNNSGDHCSLKTLNSLKYPPKHGLTHDHNQPVVQSKTFK